MWTSGASLSRVIRRATRTTVQGRAGRGSGLVEER
jgi:hypothetical protein